MYRRPKFLEVLLEIRRQMAVEADHSVEVLTEIARTGEAPEKGEAESDGTTTPRAARRRRARKRLVKT